MGGHRRGLVQPVRLQEGRAVLAPARLREGSRGRLAVYRRLDLTRALRDDADLDRQVLDLCTDRVLRNAAADAG